MSVLVASLTLFCSLTISRADSRLNEFARIQNYELVHFDIDHDLLLLNFTSFGHEYRIQLVANEQAIPANLRHTNGIPESSSESEQYFTSLARTCHFYGAVLSDTSDPLQRVSLSLCPNRGVRGEIRAFNETVYIRPARYYLDLEHDSTRFHELTDQHLIYRHSDFDMRGIPKMEALHIDDADAENPNLADKASMLKALIPNSDSRRRTLWNSGSTNVELYVMADWTMMDDFKRNYPTSWYQQLSAEMADYVQAVSSKYRALNFAGWNIGTISVSMVELEVFTWFQGEYASLYPSPTCSDYTNPGCTINGIQYLLKFDAFIKNKNPRNFDNAQMITKYYFAAAGGYGWVGKICKNDYNVANINNNYGSPHLTTGAAHEMGHNFGCDHDGDGKSADCGSGQGFMGGEAEGLSYCSYRSIYEYFRDSGGLTCLGTGVRGLTRSGYYEGDTGDTDNGDDNIDTGGGCNTATQCIAMYQMDGNGNDFNQKSFAYSGCFNDAAYYYTADGYYLFRQDSGQWVVSQQLSYDGTNTIIYSESTSCDSPFDCHYEMMVYGAEWYKDTDGFFYDCAPSDAAFIASDDCVEATCDALEFDNKQWALLADACVDGFPVYHWNESQYLRFEVNAEFVDANASAPETGRWMRSDSPLGSGVAFCNRSELMECTTGAWVTLQGVYSDEDADDEDSLTFDGVLSFVADTSMNVRGVDCSWGSSEAEHGIRGGEVVAVVLVVAVLCIVIAGCVVFLYFRKREAVNGGKAPSVATEATDGDGGYNMTTLNTQENERDDEELEVDVEVPMNPTEK